jgi:pilus assembly protein CpaE
MFDVPVAAGHSRTPEPFPDSIELSFQHPPTGVVIVTDTLDQAFLLDALRAGANEVVAEPIAAADLSRAITTVAAQRTLQEGGLVFGFVGAKGGVGKTTVAVNIAAALAVQLAPARTLLMDAHPFGGDAALFFAASANHSITDALENIARLDQTYFRGLVLPVAANLDLLAGSDQVRPVAIESSRLRALITFAAATYNYTVLDLPRTDIGVLDALERVNTIVVVANQELATVKAAARMVAMLQQRYGHDKVLLTLARSDRHSAITDADVERAVGCPIAAAFPNDYRLALRALHSGRPVAMDDHHQLAEAYRRFAMRLSGKEQARQETAGGLFGRRAHAGLM